MRYFYFLSLGICVSHFLKKAAHEKELANKIFLEEQKESTTSDGHLIDSEYKMLGQRAVEILPPRCQKIYKLSRNQGKGYEGISAEMDISPNTVKNQMSKALGLMREYLVANTDIAFLWLISVLLS